MTDQPRRIAVIGGGITGLAAAHSLVQQQQEVVLFEASDRVGGKILTSPFAGHAAIDEGADAFLARVPWGSAPMLRPGRRVSGRRRVRRSRANVWRP